MVNNRHEFICSHPNLYYVDHMTNYSTQALKPLLSDFTPLGIAQADLIYYPCFVCLHCVQNGCFDGLCIILSITECA